VLFVAEKDGHAYGTKRIITVLAASPREIDTNMLNGVDCQEVRRQ
jgi:hypothetical protein